MQIPPVAVALFLGASLTSLMFIIARQLDRIASALEELNRKTKG